MSTFKGDKYKLEIIFLIICALFLGFEQNKSKALSYDDPKSIALVLLISADIAATADDDDGDGKGSVTELSPLS